MSSQNIQPLHISILGLQPGVSELRAAGFYPAWFLERKCSLCPCVFLSSFSSWTSSSFLARKSPTCWKKPTRNMQIAAMHNVLQHRQASSLRCLSWISWLSQRLGLCTLTYMYSDFFDKAMGAGGVKAMAPSKLTVVWSKSTNIKWEQTGHLLQTTPPSPISVLVQSSQHSPSPQWFYL